MLQLTRLFSFLFFPSVRSIFFFLFPLFVTLSSAGSIPDRQTDRPGSSSSYLSLLKQPDTIFSSEKKTKAEKSEEIQGNEEGKKLLFNCDSWLYIA